MTKKENWLSGLDKTTKKKLIQFSKLVVAFVVIVVSVMCYHGMILTAIRNDMSAVSDIIGKYIDFAKLAFVSYSVNSISEKAIFSKTSTQQMEENGENEGGTG